MITDPLDGDPEVDLTDDEPEGGDEPELEGAEPEPSDEDAPLDGADEGDDEGVEPEFEEFDTGTEKFMVQKGFKDYADRWRASQTQRDQALAEERKAVESYVREQAELSQDILTLRGNLAHTEQLIEQYQNVDWNAWAQYDQQNGTNQVAILRSELDKLKDYRDKSSRDLAGKIESTRSAQRDATSKRIEQAAEFYRNNIPGWIDAKAPEKSVGPQVMQFAHETYGFTPAQLGYDPNDPGAAIISDTRIGMLLYDAYVGRQLRSKVKPAPKPKPQDESRPTPARAVGRGSTPKRGLSDRDPTKTWMEKRAKQLQNRAR